MGGNFRKEEICGQSQNVCGQVVPLESKKFLVSLKMFKECCKDNLEKHKP